MSAQGARERVALFIESGGPGGAESVVLRLALGLRERGHPVVVVTTRCGWLTEGLVARGLRHVRIDAGRRLDLSFPLRLARLLRREGAQVLHSHLLDSNFYGALAARLAGLRHVASEHGDVHHTQRKKLLRTKVRAISALRSAVTAVSEHSARELVRLGAHPARVTTVGNPVDAVPALDEGERKALRASLLPGPGADDAWLWVHVANHRPVKDQATLLRGFARARARGARAQGLCLVGDGPERAALEALARELGIAACTQFLGFRDDVARWLRAADGFVLSSRSEALPMSLLEACRAELLPVATAVGGIGEVLRDGENGYLVAPGDDEALGAALARAADDPARSRALARSARAEVEARFSVDAILEAYLALYRR